MECGGSESRKKIIAVGLANHLARFYEHGWDSGRLYESWEAHSGSSRQVPRRATQLGNAGTRASELLPITISGDIE